MLTLAFVFFLAFVPALLVRRERSWRRDHAAERVPFDIRFGKHLPIASALSILVAFLVF
jgi:hypothetical protein